MSKSPAQPNTFDRAYTILNKAQKKAVDTIEGPVMVIAGPGTGKTTILTLRIANILRLTDTSPDSILALTFTESGAHTMRRKLLETIGPAAYKVAIHTFHGFAAHTIEYHPDYFSRIIGSKLITEAEQIRIIEKIIESGDIEALRPYGDPTYYVRPVLREIHVLKRENVSPAVLLKSVDVEEESGGELSATETEKRAKRVIKNKELAFVYSEYEKALAKAKQYDFDDMLLEIIRATEKDADFKLILQEKYQYILADEHQDANAAQNRILELLSDFHQSPNLFIVGDDKQAIYRFQGASLENFLYFSHKYPDAVVIDLEHNYRSHQGILDAAHSLIGKNPSMLGRNLTELKSLLMGRRAIHVLECATVDDELEMIVHRIKTLLEEGETPDEIAVLYRDNKHAASLAAILKSHGISHRIESDHNVMDDMDVVKILTLCRAIQDPSDGSALAQALFIRELGADSAEVAALCARASKERKPLHRLLKETVDPQTKSVRQAYARIIDWSHQAKLVSCSVFLQKVIQETNLLLAIVSAPDSLERLNSVQAFFDHVVAASQSARIFRLADFMAYLDITEAHGISTRRTYTEHIHGVRLMTAHRAKGQEFNYVFIIHVVDGVWGNRSSRHLFHIPVIEHARATGRIDDERRLFYVALTRARKDVTVSYASSDVSKDTIASQFISEIDPSLLETEKVHVEDPTARMITAFMSQKSTVLDTSISILQPDFVRAKFLGQPLSVTHLNNYLECPWRYFFVNLIRIPQAENKHQLYGTAIHAALRTFFDSYKEGEDLVLKRLIELFVYHVDALPFAADDREDALKKGTKALEGYHKTYYPQWNRRLLSEYAVRGTEVAIEKGVTLELSGKLDKIELIDDRNVVVVDYKTGKPKSRNQIEGKVASNSGGEGNYFRQLAFYKLLLEGDAKFNLKYGEIDFIEPNDRGKYKVERFEIDSEAVQKVKDEIVAMAKDILSLSFIDSECDDPHCEYCVLGKLLVDK